MTNPMMGSYEYYERLYEVEEGHWWSRGMRDIAQRILDAHLDGAKGLTVLDSGCGTGITLSWLERYSEPDKVVGIDLARYALQFCRRRRDFLLCQSSVLDLPFKSDSFDLVVCNDVIQHLPGRGSDTVALSEFHRVLKPDGYLLVRTNSSQGTGKGRLSEHDGYRMYGLDELREGVQEAGFHTLKQTYANALLGVIPTVKRYLTQRKTRPYHDHGLSIRRLPAHLQWLNTLLFWVMKGEAWFLSNPSRTLSFGNTIIFLAQKRDSDASSSSPRV